MPPRSSKKKAESYDYTDEKKMKRVTKVYRPPGSTGRPSQSWMKGLETGFPTKAEFNKLFPKSERLIAEHKKWKGFEFAWAAEAPRELRAWVAEQVKVAVAAADPAFGTHIRGLWCKLPKGPKGQDAVPKYGALLELRKQSRDPADAASSTGNSGLFWVMHSSARLSTHQRGVCFLLVRYGG